MNPSSSACWVYIYCRLLPISMIFLLLYTNILWSFLVSEIFLKYSMTNAIVMSFSSAILSLIIHHTSYIVSENSPTFLILTPEQGWMNLLFLSSLWILLFFLFLLEWIVPWMREVLKILDQTKSFSSFIRKYIRI